MSYLKHDNIAHIENYITSDLNEIIEYVITLSHLFE